jgi:dipeptidyl aminopeptidase/acylaminoacyl peptidase
MGGDNWPMATQTRELISALFQTRSAYLVDLDDSPEADGRERLLVLSNLTGTMQLCELVDGELHELTALPESVSDAAYLDGPSTGARRAVIASAVGGNERDQLYLLDLDAAAETPVCSVDELQALSADPDHGHHFAGASPDGRLIAYTSNRHNGVEFDLWTLDLEGGEHRLLWAGGGWCHPGSGFSPDGRLVSVLLSSKRPLDDDLVLVDVESGEAHWPLPHPDEPALLGAPTWIDARSFYVAANLGSDFRAILRHDLDSGETETLPGTGVGADSIGLIRADSGQTVLVENRDCATPMFVYNAAGGDDGADAEAGRGEQIPWPAGEPGISANLLPAPKLSRDGRRLYFTLTTPRGNADVYRCELGAQTVTRLTHSPSDVDPDSLVPAELHTISSFDGEPVQLFLYRPASGEANPPVVTIVHGGPESQSQLMFNPIAQALAAAGYGVVVPNVRGSTGYGKRFAALDDTVRRLDSVADLAAVHGALAELGFDPARAALWGGSYGGYMVLAGVSMQPELWAAGVDIVGISDLVTFLENTSAYRRAYREAEYGSLEHDRDFLVRASPMTYVDQIRAPLFVIHGRNDPRVPVTEAEQLEANLRARNVPCELVIYENEGHGLARLENRLDAYPRAIAFLDQQMQMTDDAAGRHFPPRRDTEESTH